MHIEGRKNISGIKTDNFISIHVEDEIITEEALQILINGKPFTVTMRTPGDDEELIRGLLFTEDIYTEKKPLSVKVIDWNEEEIPTLINVAIPPALIGHSFYEARSMMSVSSCGICGKKQWTEQKADLEILNFQYKIDSSWFLPLFEKMKTKQSLFHLTGGCHAAACFDIYGNMLSIKEDIGRHNAVDKVIGDLLISKVLDKAVIILVSGRISYEIVSKAYKGKIPFLAAVSSPSTLSIKVADDLGMTLLGFCRKNSLTCYAHPERINFPQ